MRKRSHPQHDSLLRRAWRRIRRWFLTGLVVFIPLIVTFYILLTIFQFADGLLGKFLNRYLARTYGYTIPGLGLALTILLVLGIGAVVSTNVVGARVVRWLEGLVAKLPLVRHIYPSVREIADFFFGKDRPVAFQRVVLVEYPKPGIWSVGFVTNEHAPAVSQTLGRPMCAVLIPTPPSPLSGPIIFVPEKETQLLDITVEEGLKLAMSGGVLVPHLTHQEKKPSSDRA